MSNKVGPLPPPALTEKMRLFCVEMNPYCHRVKLILDAKRVSYEVKYVDPVQLPNWFVQKNPRLKIPVLEIPNESKYLFESVVICDFVDEMFPKYQLHSTDPFKKAQDRLIIERFNELIKGSLECFDTNFAFGSEQILETLDVLENEITDRDTAYFSGDSKPGMLDYMIWPWVERLYLLKCVSENKFNEKLRLFPNFAEWGDQMQLDPFVKKHSKSPLEYFEYYKNARMYSMGCYF